MLVKVEDGRNLLSITYFGCNLMGYFLFFSFFFFFFFGGAVMGITASSDSSEEQARISMALLAGKAIMSLTLIWGVVVAFGSYDLSLPPTSTSSDLEQDSKPFSLTGC